MIAAVHGLAGRRRDLRALLDELAGAALGESGCDQFRVLELADPGEMVLIAAWADERALRAHFATPHYRRYRQAVGELLARPSDVTIHHVNQTIHPIDPGPPDPVRFD
jgi:quinol monooxygenase YgiN